MGIFTNDTKKVVIRCQGAAEAHIDQLHELQGKLKTDTDEGYNWQKDKIIKYGFSFPMDIWKDDEGKLWEIDGHRRLRTLRRMRDEGYEVPLIPINYVFCTDRKEAKEKVLLAIAQPEEITDEGFEEFITEEGLEMEEDHANDLLALDESEEVEEETQPAEEKPKKEKELPCEKCVNYHERNHDEQ